MKDKELKPCPFCGGEGKMQVSILPTMLGGLTEPLCLVECKDCFASTFCYYNKKELAIKAWNTRPSQEADWKKERIKLRDDLYNKYGDSIIKRSTIDNIFDDIEQRGFVIRTLLKPEAVPMVTTQRYNMDSRFHALVDTLVSAAFYDSNYKIEDLEEAIPLVKIILKERLRLEEKHN